MTTIVNLKLARSVQCGWENEYGMKWWREQQPQHPTFLGSAIHPDRPIEQRDTWQFFVLVNFAAHQTDKFYGERATALWKEWKARQFSSNKIKPNHKCNRSNKHHNDHTQYQSELFAASPT